MAEALQVHSNAVADVFFLEGSKALLVEQKPKNLDDGLKLLDFNSRLFASWGNDNLEPQNIIDDVRNNPQLSAGLYWKTNALVSGGLVYGTVSYDEKTGQEILHPVRDPEIESWIRKTNVSRYLHESTHEFYKFWNVFPRVTRANDGTISQLHCLESAFCRWGKQNANNEVDTCFVNAQWQIFQNVTDQEYIVKYPVLDPYWKTAEQFKRNSQLNEFIYPIQGLDSGSTYYAEAPWNSIRRSGWLGVLKAIPKYKLSFLEKQYSFKYLIQVTKDYWLFRFPNYESMTEEQKNEAKQKFRVEMDDKLSGPDQAGKSLVSIAETNPATHAIIPGISIEAVDDKVKSDMYIEDSQEGASYVWTALGVPAALMPSTIGKGMNNSGGSEQRVAYNIYMCTAKPEADLILEPLQFAFEVNGFNKKYKDKGGLVTWFKNYWVSTLDSGKESQQQTK